MKNIKHILSLVLMTCAMATTALMSACYSDEGNYEYISEEEAGKITFDTIGIANRLALVSSLNPGDTIVFEPNVHYAHPERLRYRWFVLTLTNGSYQAIQNGNIMEYPAADTIAYTKKLDWVVDLEPGTYRFYLMAEDSVTGMRGYYQAQEQYTLVNQSGSQSGLYLLTERDGQTDIEIFTSDLMLIYGSQKCYYKYYSQLTGKYLEGKPRWIRGTHTGSTSKNGYLVATDKNLYRLNSVGLATMNDWSTMFYNTPENFDPQCAFFTNRCDFLINDGKLHVLYANKSNDRKFSDPIAGDYEAYPYLMFNTLASWRPVTGAINAYQVIFDEKNHKFRPYYNSASSVSSFKSTTSGAYVDANNVPTNIKTVFNGGGDYTCVIAEDADGTPWLYRYCFYNVVDNGDLSASGSRSKINLSQCTNIKDAKLFASNTAGYAFYYATDNAVYSFSASSGQETSNTLYTCESGETVTAMYAYGSQGGGWPTSSCILWIGVWNENTKEGKLIQYEVDNNYGVEADNWSTMFGCPGTKVVTTGWGKIVGMTCVDAE